MTQPTESLAAPAVLSACKCSLTHCCNVADFCLFSFHSISVDPLPLRSHLGGSRRLALLLIVVSLSAGRVSSCVRQGSSISSCVLRPFEQSESKQSEVKPRSVQQQREAWSSEVASLRCCSLTSHSALVSVSQLSERSDACTRRIGTRHNELTPGAHHLV